MLRTGILMPRSSLYPSLGLDIINGLKQCLKQEGIFDEIKLATDNIGFGIDEADIYSKAEKMLLQEDMDVVILCADSKIIEMLRPLFTASNKILLAVNFGANLPESWEPEPTTIIHSLNFCFHASLTGKLAADETNKQTANVLSYYDGGYNQCYCMLNSNHVNGGIPLFNHITHLKAEEFTLKPLEDFLEKNNDVTTLLCLFAGYEAEKFYHEISVLQQKLKLNLYVSPMMLDEILTTSLNNELTIQNIQGYIPWHSSVNNNTNKLFADVYTSSTNKKTNYFSLLGWETGLILAQINKFFASNTNATEAVKWLTQISFNSPRGWLKIDPATHHSYGPSYLANCKNNMEVNLGNEIIDIEKSWREFTKEKLPQAESSAWRNTYLCI